MLLLTKIYNCWLFDQWAPNFCIQLYTKTESSFSPSAILPLFLPISLPLLETAWTEYVLLYKAISATSVYNRWGRTKTPFWGICTCSVPGVIILKTLTVSLNDFFCKPCCVEAQANRPRLRKQALCTRHKVRFILGWAGMYEGSSPRPMVCVLARRSNASLSAHLSTKMFLNIFLLSKNFWTSHGHILSPRLRGRAFVKTDKARIWLYLRLGFSWVYYWAQAWPINTCPQWVFCRWMPNNEFFQWQKIKQP